MVGGYTYAVAQQRRWYVSSPVWLLVGVLAIIALLIFIIPHIH